MTYPGPCHAHLYHALGPTIRKLVEARRLRYNVVRRLLSARVIFDRRDMSSPVYDLTRLQRNSPVDWGFYTQNSESVGLTLFHTAIKRMLQPLRTSQHSTKPKLYQVVDSPHYY